MASDESKAALANKSKQAQELDTQKKTLMQQAFGMQQLQNALQKYQHDSELQFKYFAEILGVEIEEAKLVSGATIDIANARKQAIEQARIGNGSAESGKQSATTDDTGGSA